MSADITEFTLYKKQTVSKQSFFETVFLLSFRSYLLIFTIFPLTYSKKSKRNRGVSFFR